MSTEWGGWMYAITDNPEAAGLIALALDPGSGGAANFYGGAKLRPIGSNDTEPTKYCAGVAVRTVTLPVIAAFDAGGYPQPLLDAGRTAEELDTARAALVLLYGPRATIEGNGLAFIAAQGFEIVPEAGA